ncbi:hypothetical protein PAXRUDRAFT_822230 [Paxillus rubicundulus Ve08.2h10]|uniref:Uncharacterized protein n=1 Tax=Paxillus rubicundulus Ve08.2h10 TaxID=930991 RepID=A0A0D0E5G1_9AGAM|nr:hypothetical protein PAXRUDRAFT_822230 [Paxillus rubicundulus Ve08.2h10]
MNDGTAQDKLAENYAPACLAMRHQKDIARAPKPRCKEEAVDGIETEGPIRWSLEIRLDNRRNQ